MDDPLTRSVGDAAVVRQVFDAMPLLVVAFEGPELRVAAATGAYRAYAGRPEVIGMPVREVFPEMLGQQAIEILEHTYATGEPVSLSEFRGHIELPDGGGPLERFANMNMNPLRGPDGEVTGVVIDLVDVTEQVHERQAAQRRVAEAERRYAEALDVVHALQRELLPAGVPVLPQVQIAGAYLLADADTAAGGDWFDAVALPDGRVALTVGDVVGHGVTASATMGQLRALLNERLTTTGDVHTAVADLDRVAGRVRGAHAATVCVVILDPATGALTYTTAGHPPPLLLPRDGDARYLAATGTGPLGVRAAGHPGVAVRTDRLDAGDMLLLYTDGILERPGRTLAQSTVELARAGAAAAAGRALAGHESTAVERVCNQTLEMLIRVTGHTDDVTVLAAQRVPPPAPFSIELAADPASLPDLRNRFGDWLAGIAVAERDASVLQHAVTELATNALEHAYLDSVDANTVTVTAALRPDGVVEAEVRDHGGWRDPRPSPDRGLGLVITSKLVDDLRLTHDDTGSTATVTHELCRPARLLTVAELSAVPAAPTPRAADPFLILDQPAAPGPRVRVDGPVDAHTAPHLDNALRVAGAVGTRDLTVDLTDVTHLASAAVAVLHRLAALSAANGHRLRLYAPPGTPADMIMTLVDLPHLTVDPDG
ncbi:SpoIIE family protein phosphatase [Virgisporangium aurantiacum]|uniref:STAS domain-containing protein n=1 Tax=Virgisporangium aurantiacum TaxID=175570 RepID=A0A8J3ZJ67_9ACTN|nr:SpoIIE family protein phosphatase [Virgisporangium aurantiacum]GIJ63922.1 hypothetical protein Vau01_114380 [Virgisporangium aurantiacum]